MTAPLLELRGVSKRFPGVRALDGVDLRVGSGEVAGLLGENGSGKTTLMNVLYGLVRPDAGEVRIRGARADIRSPRQARALGIGMVHQHFTLVPSLTVAENFVLDQGGRSLVWANARAAEPRIVELSRRLGLGIDPRARAGSLSVGDQQRAEILKAIKSDAVTVLVLDEPTSSLTPGEVEDFFGIVRALAASGAAVVLISHKLREVRAIADRIVVLRQGRVVAETTAAQASEAELARLMVGERVASAATAPAALGASRIEPAPAAAAAAAATRAGAPAVLALAGVTVESGRGRPPALAAIDLELHAGEVLGVAGVDGNGQDALAAVLVGLVAPDRGLVLASGRSERLTPRRAIDLGIAYIPADRRKTALAPALSVEENLVLSHWRRRGFGRGPLLDRSRIRAFAADCIERFDVRPAAADAPVAALSGGNQQRVVLARELAFSPRVVVAHNPTRGLDVAATEFVHARLLDAARAGAGVVLISADLDEVLALASRILVIFRGRLAAVPGRDPEALGLAMAGAG